MTEPEIDAFMAAMEPGWRNRWCDALACCCLGCANNAGMASTAMTREEWRSWRDRNRPPIESRVRDNLVVLLGFVPERLALECVRQDVEARGWKDEPYLLAAMYCVLMSAGGEEWMHRAGAYARRGGYDSARLGVRPP